MADRAPSPTPSERARKDAEDRKREEAEQASLPYKWTQTLEEAEVSVPIPGNLKARDLVVELKKNHIKVGVKGQQAIIDVSKRWRRGRREKQKGPSGISCIHIHIHTHIRTWTRDLTLPQP
jgi:HSP20 family molecular chaperone IbpA